MADRINTFAARLRDGQPLIGTFLKTPSPVLCEVLGFTPLEVVCIDTEHAPFGRLETDACVSQLRAADLPSLVRIADDSATEIRNALDAGATGIVVPHVTTSQQAQGIASHAHFGEGGRGYAGSTRAAGFTTKAMGDHIADSAKQTAVVLQIEDLAALDHVEDIARTPGVDCLFIGRVDLAVAMGLGVYDKPVVQAVTDICRIGKEQGMSVGMFTPRMEEIPDWKARGASLFLLGSDHGFILDGARSLAEGFSAG